MTSKSLKLPYTPRNWQLEVAKAAKRFTVLVCHRRGGKTVFNIMQNIGRILSCKKQRPQGAYIAPNYGMAKRIAWDYYKEFLEPMRKLDLVTFNETALRIDFKNGAKIFLLGAEDPDSIRGMYLDDVVLDEYADMPADFFEKVIRPLLSDRKGSCTITGTPKGREHFFEMYQRGSDESNVDWTSFLYTWKQTGAVDREEIEAAKRDMSEEAFAQEYECSFEAAIIGAYFGKNIAKLRTSGRICDKSDHDPRYPVVSSWDIGFDGTVIWHCQKIDGSIRIIDCDIFVNKDIPQISQVMLNKPYTYECQLLPFDAGSRHVTDRSKTTKGMLQNMGLKCKIVPRIKRDDGIHAARNLIDRAMFSPKCDEPKKSGRQKISAVDSLSLYRAEWDLTSEVQKPIPVHDKHSHVADSFRTLAVGLKDYDMSTVNALHRRRNVKPTELVQNKWNPFRR